MNRTSLCEISERAAGTAHATIASCERIVFVNGEFVERVEEKPLYIPIIAKGRAVVNRSGNPCER